MNTVIIEDEPFLSQMLEKVIMEVNPESNVLTKLTRVSDSVRWFKNHPEPCLVFMDIQLADGICFEIFNEIDFSNKVIVFTTAYDEYVMDAFEYNSIAYILKPIKRTDIEKVFEKVGHIIDAFGLYGGNAYHRRISQLSRQISKLIPSYRQRFMISRGDGYIQLPTHGIACFHVVEKIVSAYDFKGNSYVVDFTLEKLEEELNEEQFFRANRQFIINIDAIERIENYFTGKLIVHLESRIGVTKIVVSRTKAGMLKKWVDK